MTDDFIGYVLIVLSLLWLSVSMQACTSSSTQTTLEFDFYKDGGNSSEYIVDDVVVDSSANQYLIYYDTTSGNLFVTKKNSSGDYDWSFKYPTIDIIPEGTSTVLSSDENTLRIIGDINTEE